MKKVPSHGYVRITGAAAGRPAERLSQRLFADDSTMIPKLRTPFLFGKASIGRFSKKEWAPEGAYGVILVKIGGFPSVKRVLQ